MHACRRCTAGLPQVEAVLVQQSDGAGKGAPWWRPYLSTLRQYCTGESTAQLQGVRSGLTSPRCAPVTPPPSCLPPACLQPPPRRAAAPLAAAPPCAASCSRSAAA